MSAEHKPSFTIDDIRKIREEMYEETRGMNPEELIAYYNGEAGWFEAEMEKRRRLRAAGPGDAQAASTKPAFA